MQNSDRSASKREVGLLGMYKKRGRGWTRSEGINNFSVLMCIHTAVHASYPACAGASFYTFDLYIYVCVYIYIFDIYIYTHMCI